MSRVTARPLSGKFKRNANYSQEDNYRWENNKHIEKLRMHTQADLSRTSKILPNSNIFSTVGSSNFLVFPNGKR